MNLGTAYTGLATVGYLLVNADGTPSGSRITAGITERGTGTGSYGATVTHPAAFTGEIRWDTGGGSPIYASEDLNPGHDEYADAPTSGIAAAVWAVLTSALTTANSIGAYLLSKLTAPSITVTSATATDGTLTLIRGDDYAAADNRALTLRITTGDDLSGGGLTATLALGAGVLTLTGGTVALVSDTTWDLTWHPTAAQTALLLEHSYRYQAWVLRSTRVLTEAYGLVTVLP